VSDYKPWAKPEAPGGEASDNTRPATMAAAAPVPMQAPGLGEAPAKKRSEIAPAILLICAGVFLTIAVGTMTTLNVAIGFEELWAAEDGTAADVVELVLFRNITLAITLPLVALFGSAGVGLLYGQSWAKPLGWIAAAIGILMFPFGTVLNAIAMAKMGDA
jgi:hypothetical protein